MRDTMLTEFASRQTTIRRFLEEYRSWIAWNSHGGEEDVNRARWLLATTFVIQPKSARRAPCASNHVISTFNFQRWPSPR
jgi:hypothetical protein